MKEMHIRWLIAMVAALGALACGELKEIVDLADGGNCECSSEDGPCCDGCNYYEASDDQVCEVYDYDCSDITCGADTQKRTGESKCQGGTSNCTGNVTWSDWVTDVICSSSQLCETDKETYATCTTCEHGCADGACYPDCNPADNCCESNGAACVHGCDGTNCWPECNPSTDNCCDVDGNSCAACDDGVFCNMTVCTGGKYDSNSNLCWEDPPAASTMNWYWTAGVYDATYNADTEDHCGDLGIGWRLPTISELRSLFRSGGVTACQSIEWDMDWTKVPSGYCGVWDDVCCLGADARVESLCNPSDCDSGDGPGAAGCYWDAALSGTCMSYWSSSESADCCPAWYVNFDGVNVYAGNKNAFRYVRCVR